MSDIPLPLTPKSRGIAAAIMLVVVVSACDQDEPDETTDASGQGTKSASETINQWAREPEACEPGQKSFETGYQNFPDLQCSQIAEKVETTFTTQVGYRKQCQQRTGAESRPKSVARVQVKECGPLKQQDGHYASMLVCCGAPTPNTRR